jgi:cyclic beta-1,2-glucan synthetase
MATETSAFLLRVTAGLAAAALMIAALAGLVFSPTSLIFVLAIALMGAAALGLWYLVLAKGLPSPISFVLDIVAVGAIAYVRNPSLAVWQLPGHWLDWQLPSHWLEVAANLLGTANDVRAISPAGAVVACSVYFIASLTALAWGNRTLSLGERIGIILLPLAFNLVLALGSAELMRELGDRLAHGAIGDIGSIALGRMTLIFVLEEVLIGILLVTMVGRWLGDLRLHLLLAGAAIHAALTPWIADLPARLSQQPHGLQVAASIGCAAAAQAGLWAIVFLLTGSLIDSLLGKPPIYFAAVKHWTSGLVKGAIYGGLFMLIVLVLATSLRAEDLLAWGGHHLLLSAALAGGLLFPLVATIVASADETPPFFGRLVENYQAPRLYLRGVVIGLGAAWALSSRLREAGGSERFLWLFLVGALAFAGVDCVFDAVRVLRGLRQKVQSWRVYILGALLGGLVGGALGWYFDAPQIAVVSSKFWSYADLAYPSAGRPSQPYIIYALFNKWGSVDLGLVGGGVRLFYDESLSGVINWSLAAPLFSVNYFALAALMRRSLAPLKELFSAQGFEGLVEQAVRVMRWGLWMAPVIFSFLRLAPDPSWYNQDGAIRSVAATIAYLGLPSESFRNWSLAVFTGLLAYDWLRVIIWFDHMGLRVATLVNLSFLGGDRADEAAARFAGHPARTRFIPEGIRRFATWAPLLIPFYIPRGAEWDRAWSGADTIRATSPEISSPVMSVVAAYICALVGGIVIAVLVAARARQKLGMAGPPLAFVPSALAETTRRFRTSNGLIAFELLPDGRGFTHVHATARKGGPIDITRRPSDPLQLRGPFVYLREAGGGETWSIGFEPAQRTGADYAVNRLSATAITMSHTMDDIHAVMTLDVDRDGCAEIQRVVLSNRATRRREIIVTSLRELAIHEPGAYGRDPDFNGMHVETAFVSRINTIFARNRLLRNGARKQELRRMSSEIAFHAARTNVKVRLVGYEDSRTRFIGSGSLREPQGLGEGRPRSPSDEGVLYTFDPAASLTLAVDLEPGESREVTFVTGHARNERSAAGLIARLVGGPELGADDWQNARRHQRELEPLPAAPPESWPFTIFGSELCLSQHTPRPWAHVLANPAGYGCVVSNEGEIYSFSGNARHNGLTPFGFDSVAVPLPGQLIYVADLATGDTHTAGFVPYRRADAQHEIRYAPGVAQFKKIAGDIEIELTIFVAADRPADLRLLTVRNKAATAKSYRIVPYFDMALDESPRDSLGWLETAQDQGSGALLFSNPHNDFQRGWAFAATSLVDAGSEMVRQRFLGPIGRDLSNPIFVESGRPDSSRRDDGRRVAAFCGTLDVAGGGEASCVVVLGQAPTREEAVGIAVELRQPAAARAALARTLDFWQSRLSAIKVETNQPEFDRLVNSWLPYQLLAARLWGRVGPNQRGGATGFRDQLQDVLPLVFSDPGLVRRQILLHAGQQFIEGDVLKWWHAAPSGGTGLGQRTRASDPHLWLPYVVSRYVAATGDSQILAENIAYLDGAAVPEGTDTLLVATRPSRDFGDLYDHCRRAIDFALDRIGAHGLPLLGAGDWNDGLDLVGFRGRGESVWLGFFLHNVLITFAERLARDEAIATRYRQAAERLRLGLESAWRSDHYLLAFDDSGTALDEFSAMTAVWPILSGATDAQRGRLALERSLLALERDARILLLTPPYTEASVPYPGRIADYPPGVRENGGQYSHGVSWAVDAYVRLAELAAMEGRSDEATHLFGRAFECWRKISPMGKTSGPRLAVYGLAPHQQPADIYDGAGHDGRGGWSWYTGSAARMLSAAYALIGVTMENGEIRTADTVFDPKGLLQVKSLTIQGQRIGKDDRVKRG